MLLLLNIVTEKKMITKRAKRADGVINEKLILIKLMHILTSY